MPYPRTGHRSPTAARQDVLGLLRGDHDRVLDEFREFDRLESLAADQACQRVVQRTFAELKVLADVEQRLFYPAVHDAIVGTDLIDQSEIEHARIRRWIEELEEVEPMHVRYRSSFRTLGEYVRQHVHDEERELYPVLSETSIDWETLYEQMRSRRARLAEDLGVADIDQPDPSADTNDLAPLDDDAINDEEPELALEGHH